MKIVKMEIIKFYPDVISWEEYKSRCPDGYRLFSSEDANNIKIISNSKNLIIKLNGYEIELKRTGYKERNHLISSNTAYFHCEKLGKKGYMTINNQSTKPFFDNLSSDIYGFSSIYIKK